MKVYSYIMCLALVLIIVTPTHSQTAHQSTSDDQVGVEVTVYNNNLGLVKDVRETKLGKGEGELKFMDVAASIMPVTVQVKSLSDPDGFAVLEQNYEYDLISSKKLLDKYVGKKIKLIDRNQYQDRKDVIDATLLSNNQGQVYRIGDEIYLGHPGIRVLPKLPQDLIAKPTLTWLYSSGSDKPQKLEVSYLTNNIHWKADYVVVLNKDDDKADMSGWVTIDNKSGAAYRNARLKLVAGEVHRAEPKGVAFAGVPQELARRAKREQFQEKAFFEYHIYDLQRRTTIKNKQTKQIRLLEARGVGMEKELLVHGVKTWFTRQYREEIPKQPVNVYVKLKNSKDNNLGMPLPAGIMRLYKDDSDGSRQFVGEDRVKHTPKDEEVKLKIGEAFDVVAERKQTDYKRLTTRMHESEWEITLRNHKDKAVEVGIVEPLYGNWAVIDKTHPYKKEGAFTIRFDVNVPKDGEVKVKYRVQVGI